ncbi:hypothetical protein [Fodinicurvata sediminis]|uniref:hypothetical protein n=1 Tax=Fodinicurvata sediminis TaxID=1121832 RepID=UPI0003B31787|nr:hypothetical protein [Fodinicurvata sediminis]
MTRRELRYRCLELALSKGHSVANKPALRQAIDDYESLILAPEAETGEGVTDEDPEENKDPASAAEAAKGSKSGHPGQEAGSGAKARG